jgi:hypothetical protein
LQQGVQFPPKAILARSQSEIAGCIFGTEAGTHWTLIERKNNNRLFYKEHTGASHDF